MRVGPATLAAALALVPIAAPANAALFEFDCDVPANRYSSVSSQGDQLLSISGIITPISYRSGKFEPVAGALLGDSDGANTTTFQLVATSRRPKHLVILTNIKRGEDVRSGQVGTIRADEPVPFSMSLSESGMVQITIADQTFNHEFMPLSSGKEMLFCSTGQFKFSEIAFSGRISDAPERLSP